MNNLLWQLPIPSSSLGEGVVFQELSGRECTLSFKVNRLQEWQITFKDVEAYRCHYYQACTVEMIDASYDRLIDAGKTKWLVTVRDQLSKYNEGMANLRHMMIYFDDGPCYEFICQGFSVQQIYLSND